MNRRSSAPASKATPRGLSFSVGTTTRWYGALWKGFKDGMQQFGKNTITLINSILLAVGYLLGVGLTALIAKLFGKHFLDMKKRAGKASYWRDVELRAADPKAPDHDALEEHYRQF